MDFVSESPHSDGYHVIINANNSFKMFGDIIVKWVDQRAVRDGRFHLVDSNSHG